MYMCVGSNDLVLLDAFCVDVGHAFTIARIGVAQMSMLVNLEVLDDDCRIRYSVNGLGRIEVWVVPATSACVRIKCSALSKAYGTLFICLLVDASATLSRPLGILS